MSIPISAIASTAAGFNSLTGFEPAEKTLTLFSVKCFNKPAAICERPALCMHINRTLEASLPSADITNYFLVQKYVKLCPLYF